MKTSMVGVLVATGPFAAARCSASILARTASRVVAVTYFLCLRPSGVTTQTYARKP